MKRTKASVSQLFVANEKIQHVIVDSFATATELSHSVAFSAETLPCARTSSPHTKHQDAAVINWDQQPETISSPALRLKPFCDPL